MVSRRSLPKPSGRTRSPLPRLWRSVWLLCLGAGFVFPLPAEDAALLTAPAKLRAGAQSAFSLTLFDARTQAPLQREVHATLVSADGSERYALFTGMVRGHARVEFEVPPAQASAFVLSAEVSGLAEPLRISTSLERSPAILIETDKPIYRPSQAVRGRVVLLDSRLRPVEDDVEVTVHDAKGLRVARFNLSTDRYGVAPFSLVLASEVNFGTWKVRARSHNAESLRDIRVEEYTLPRYELGLDFEKPWALVDEPVTGVLGARYFFGRDVEGTARIRAKRWIGVWEEYASAEGSLSNGHWSFQLPPVGFVTGTVANSGQGAIVLEASVTDSTGHEQSRTEWLTITEAPVVVSLIASAKTLKPGIETPVHVRAETPEGLPLNQEVDVTTRFYAWNESLIGTPRETRVLTVEGTGAFLLDPPPDAAFARIEAAATRQNRRTRVSIYIGSAWSPSRSFLSVARVGSGPITIGDTLTFSVTSTEPGTVYYEVYAAGRTILSDASEDASFSFAVTPEMVPRAKVVVYRIGSSNEIAADSLDFPVRLPISVSLSAEFDAEQVRPGDPVEIILDSGTGGPTLLGVSIVDESLLFLGNSRLHLAEVFEELERRFMEPQVEVHDEEPPPAPIRGLWAESPGALDVLHAVGLKVAATRNISLPSGRDWDFRGGVVPINISPPTDAGAVPAGETPPRLREYFPETWLWSPSLLTDETGRARLTLTAPDSITGWRLSVVGTTPEVRGADHGILFGEAKLTVFQEFFVEPSLPYAVVRGETFPVKVDVFNYLDHPQTVNLYLEGSEGFEIVGADRISTTAPANRASFVTFRIHPGAIGEFPLRITAWGEFAGDAVLRPLRVIAEGTPAEQVLNGVLEPGAAVLLTPSPVPGMVEDSLRAFLFLSASPVAQSMKGVAGLLNMPFGCGEQNMIFLAPNIEILKYLREMGELAPEIRAEAEYFINVGYQRQLTFRTEDGGFSAFGGRQGSLWLTAFVLSTFSEAREVRDIDENVLADAAAMILSRQLADGSFETDDFLIHKEMEGGLENLIATTAYVAKALAEYGGVEGAQALVRAAQYVEDNLSLIWDDPYSLAIAAVSLQGIDGYREVSEAVVDRLLELAIEGAVGIHWAPYPVETTGYAAIALLRSDGGAGRPEARAAVDWLSTQRNSLGGYGGSTQDTVVALRALFEAVRKVHRDLNVEVSVLQNGRPLFVTDITGSNFDVVQQFELPIDGGPLELRSVGRGNVGFQWVRRYNLPGHLLPPPRDMLLEVRYLADHVEVDDLVDVEVRLEYTGLKPKTGMVIADVGVPTGFEAVTASLGLLEDRGTVERAEVAGRKVIFYIEGLERNTALVFRFQVRALFPIRAQGPVSTAYEYYDADVRAFDRSPDLAVFGPAPEIETVDARELAPGREAVVTGRGFASGPLTILIGGVRVESYTVIDDSTLVITVPRLPEGPVDLSVSSDSGSATWNDAGRLAVSPVKLYFPVHPLRQGSFTGFALVNHSDRPARIRFQVRDEVGNRPLGREDPVTFDLDPGRQMALLGEEIFAGYSDLPDPSWVEVSSDNPEVSGYSLFGSLREMDSLGGLAGKAANLYFTRVVEGPSEYLGRSATTRLGVANPGNEPALVRLSLRATEDSSGRMVVRTIEREIPAGGLLAGTPNRLFGSTEGLSDAYVSVVVTQGEGVVGFELIEFPEQGATVGLAPQTPTPATRLFAPQVAHAPSITTEVNLVNTGDQPRTVSMAIFSESGERLTAWASATLDPGRVFRRSLAACFALGEAEELHGYLVVDGGGPGVIGDVLIADPLGLRFATAYSLRQPRSTETVLSQVANGAGMFTGLALLNPSDVVAEITVEVFSADGVSQGSAHLSLDPGHSLARLVPELVPASAGLVGGYLMVRSSVGILLQQILGELELEYFSIVAPAAVR